LETRGLGIGECRLEDAGRGRHVAPVAAGARKVSARFRYNANVARKAASSSPSSEKAPRTRSISEYCMVARLSVMITGSIDKPDPLALSLSTRTTTLLACPVIAALAEIQKQK
jgi:hypothetical protein